MQPRIYLTDDGDVAARPQKSVPVIEDAEEVVAIVTEIDDGGLGIDQVN